MKNSIEINLEEQICEKILPESKQTRNKVQRVNQLSYKKTAGLM